MTVASRRHTSATWHGQVRRPTAFGQASASESRIELGRRRCEARSSAARADGRGTRRRRPAWMPRGDRGQLLEQDGVPDRPGAAAPDEDQVARDVQPQAQDEPRRPRRRSVGRRSRRRRVAASSASAFSPAARSAASVRSRRGGVVGAAAGVAAAPRRRVRGRRPDRRPGRSSAARPGPIARGMAARAAASRADGRAPVRSSRTRVSSARIEHGFGRPRVGERETRPATGQAAEPGGGRRVGQAVVGQDGLDVARPDQARAGPGSSATGRSAGAGPRWSAHSTIVTPAGGSSRVLSSADWASSFIRSAPSMMATRAPPSTGIRASSPMRSRMPRNLASGPPMTTWRPGPTGPSR